METMELKFWTLYRHVYMKGLDEFLSSLKSIGPLETTSSGTEFTSFEAADLDVKFLQALVKKNHRTSTHVCKASWFLCANSDGEPFFRKRCPKNTLWKMFNGGILVDINTPHPRLILPPDLKDLLKSCTGRRFLVVGFGLYPTSDLVVGHSNALVLDTMRRVIERYEPSGKPNAHLDNLMKRRFSTILPGWTYIGYHGSQEMADSFDGMCVTFSLMFILLRLLNPDATPDDVRRYMSRMASNGELRDIVLRLNRHVADTLRMHRRGSLVKRKRVHTATSLASSVERDRMRTFVMIRGGRSS